MGEGNVIGNVSNNGEVTYRENVKAEVEGKLSESEYWVSADTINSIYILIDKKNKKTIAGIGDIEESASEYAEVSIERIFVKEDTGRVEYTKNPYTYVPLEDVSEKDMQNVYNSFEQYYLDRIKEKQAENHKESIESRG